MVAIFSGNGLGLNLSSMSALGGRGLLGTATQGRNGERAYVNAATGNLVLQDADALLVGLGPDVAGLRTYNSQGGFDFDGNADGWHGAVTRAIQDVGGGVLRRIDLDRSTIEYDWVEELGLYRARVTVGSAVDTIARNADGTFTWTDGATQTKETYAAGALGLITSSEDASGNRLEFGYTNGRLSSVRYPGGEWVE